VVSYAYFYVTDVSLYLRRLEVRREITTAIAIDPKSIPAKVHWNSLQKYAFGCSKDSQMMIRRAVAPGRTEGDRSFLDEKVICCIKKLNPLNWAI
jgi:hypothetical protein